MSTSLNLRRGIYTYYFLPVGSSLGATEKNDRERGFTFSNPTEAVAFLRGLGGDSLTIQVFRRALRVAGVNSAGDYQDAEILDLVARELVRKRLTVIARYQLKATANTIDVEKAPARPASNATAGPKTAEPDSDTFGDPDADDQATALTAAAKNGTPFCEECERARARQAQTAPQPPPDPPSDQPNA